ncbi:hypothetical protein [Arthrobacter sunyaminii]|nr:hypothetical protein [Arthrobacter sunyaminii]
MSFPVCCGALPAPSPQRDQSLLGGAAVGLGRDAVALLESADIGL